MTERERKGWKKTIRGAFNKIFRSDIPAKSDSDIIYCNQKSTWKQRATREAGIQDNNNYEPKRPPLLDVHKPLLQTGNITVLPGANNAPLQTRPGLYDPRGMGLRAAHGVSVSSTNSTQSGIASNAYSLNDHERPSSISQPPEPNRLTSSSSSFSNPGDYYYLNNSSNGQLGNSQAFSQSIGSQAFSQSIGSQALSQSMGSTTSTTGRNIPVMVFDLPPKTTSTGTSPPMSPTSPEPLVNSSPLLARSPSYNNSPRHPPVLASRPGLLKKLELESNQEQEAPPLTRPLKHWRRGSEEPVFVTPPGLSPPLSPGINILVHE